MNEMTTQQGQQAALPALPAHLQVASGVKDNSIGAGVGSTYQAPPRISIDGRIFRMIKGDVNVPITMNVEGQTIAVPALNMVIVAGNPGRHKTYYPTSYQPGGDAERPLCYSFDGVTPSAYSDEVQSPSCATCQWNKFGSKINDQGNPTKACSDSKILAVIPQHAVTGRLSADAPGGEAYQIRVSATALSRSKDERKDNPANNTSLSEYLALLDRYPVGANSAVAVEAWKAMTRFYFEIGPSYPLLRFRLDRFLTPEEIAYIDERRQGDDVQAIVSDPGGSFSGMASAAALPAPPVHQSLPPPAYAAPAAVPQPQVAYAPQPQAAQPMAPAPLPQFAPPPLPPQTLAQPNMQVGAQAPAAPATPAPRRRGRPAAGAQAPAPATPAPPAAVAQPQAPSATAMPTGQPVFPGMIPQAAPAAPAFVQPPQAAQVAQPTSSAQDAAMAAAMAMFNPK